VTYFYACKRRIRLIHFGLTVCRTVVEARGDQVHTEAFCAWPEPFTSSIASVYTLTILLIGARCHYTLVSSLPTSRATNVVNAPVLFMSKLSFCRRVGLNLCTVSGLKRKWIIFIESLLNVLECASVEMKGVNFGTVAYKAFSVQGWKHTM
jgi:hypothetical protein